MLISILTFVLKRDYKKCLLLAFPLLIWLSAMLSPVHAEFRYIIGVYIMMPYMISILVYNPSEVQNSNKN